VTDENSDQVVKDVRIDFEIMTRKSSQDGALEIEGYASTDALDRDGERVDISSMDISEFLDNPVLLYQHDTSKPIGRVVQLEKVPDPEDGDKQRLWVKAVISSETSLGQEVINLIKAGILRAFSIGGKAAQKVRQAGAIVLRGLKLFELSIVSVPANPEALFRTSKDLGPFWSQVSEVQIAKAIKLGLANTEDEARYFKAMEMAILQSQPTGHDGGKDMTENGDAPQGGQEIEKQDAPAVPEELMVEIEAMKAQLAELSSRVAALEKEPEQPEAEPEAETETAIVAGEKKSLAKPAPSTKTVDVRKMDKSQRLALAKKAWEARYKQ